MFFKEHKSEVFHIHVLGDMDQEASYYVWFLNRVFDLSVWRLAVKHYRIIMRHFSDLW